MSKTRIAMLLTALFFFAPSHAQVYQCPGKDGKPIFTDRPCAQGQQVDVKPIVPSDTAQMEAQIRAQINQQKADEAIQRARNEVASIEAKREARRAYRAQMCHKLMKESEKWDTNWRLAHRAEDRALFSRKRINALANASRFCD